MRLLPVSLALSLCTFWAVSMEAAESARTVQSFDAGWRFARVDSPEAAQPDFVDGSWRVLAVPHDWAIEGTFEQQNPAGGGGAFLPSGVAWYRKTFTLPASASARRFFIEFDGIMAHSDVFINGTLLGHRPFGYVGFRYDLTPHLQFGAGKSNVIAVRADTSVQPASRWYAGAGIYRHVRMISTDPVHLDHASDYVTTPKITPEQATIRVESTVVNDGPEPMTVAVQTTFTPASEKFQLVPTPPQTIAPGKSATFTQDLVVPQPKLWNLDSPELYRAHTQLVSGGKTLDETTTTFGIRDAHFEPATGFWLNGKNFKLQGVCIHSEASAFGSAVPLDAWSRYLTALRALGVNAIRTAHNPPAPEFLELCDRLGFLVMDEAFDCWTVAKPMAEKGYSRDFKEWSQIDLRDMVRRDRNHPSVILYSVGNEIHDTPQQELAKKILTGLVQICHENDPTRAVTQALFRPNASHDYDNGLADLLDVIGTNYRDKELLAAQTAQPTRRIVGTEQDHARGTWLLARDNPQHAGQFIWTGIDYLGESRAWPLIASAAGLIDRLALPRARGYERQSWWSAQPVVHLARRTAPNTGTAVPVTAAITGSRVLNTIGDWTPADPAPHDENVEVYSNVESVELFLNGQSLGVQPLPKDASPRTWKVSYVPGMLKAVASQGGQVVATDELRTAGQPTKIILAADRQSLAPGWDQVGFITATVVDANGVTVPGASDLVRFEISGPGLIAAVDSADNSSHESFRGTERRAYRGVCAAIVRADADHGRITVKATADGLAEGMITLEAAPEITVP